MSTYRDGVIRSVSRRWADLGSRFVGAACAGLPGDMFFAGEDRSSTAITLRAKAVCATCGIAEACRTWAIANNETHGVWGGLTSPEREQLRTGTYAVSRRAS